MQNKMDPNAMKEAARLAKSEAGQQLFSLLKSQDNETLQKAMAQAAAGDYSQMKDTMSALLASPEAQALLQQLGGGKNG